MKLKFNTEKLFIVILLLLVSTKAISQIDPGVDFDLNSYINDRLDQGQTTVVVPPGRYRVSDFSNTHLKFSNRNNVTIIADGVEMICTETVQAIQIQDCNNFKLQGLSVDYDPLPFTQGEIVAISEDKLTLTVDLIDGYSSTLIGDKVEIYDPVTGELSARTYYGSTYVVDAQARRVIVTKGTPVDNFTEDVGDIVVIGSRGTNNIPHTITPQRCTNLILENVTVYAGTTFAFFETNCKGSKYINCSVDRRPLETEIRSRGVKRMRSNNADAFHSKFAEIGPSYVGCVARYNGDDSFAINGNFHVITETSGNVLTVVAKGGGNNTPDLIVGEVVELVSYSGERMPDATITQIQTGRALNAQEISFLQTQTFNAEADDTYTASNVYYITIDHSVDLPLGSLINSATRVGNGFEVRNCIAGPNRSRGILVKASDGIITGNTCVGNWGQAIKCSPEYSWLEAGSGNNLVISNNVISGCHDAAIAVYANGGNGSTSPIGAHNNIQIIDNQISGSSNPNIAVTSTSNLCMTDNTISSPNNNLLVPWIMNNFGRNEDPNRTIYLENVSTGGCNDFGVTGVLVIPETATIVVAETYQLTANIFPKGATNQSVTWLSSDPSVATVDSSGLVTGIAEGVPVTITVTTSDGGFTDTSTITVNSVPVYPDEVISVSGPATVNQGATVVVNVPYTASATRDLIVNFQENNIDINGDGASFTNFGSTRTTVLAGAGTLLVDVATSSSTPISSGYRYAAFLTTVGGGYAQRAAPDRAMTGVSVVEPLSTSTFENQMYSVYPNPVDDFIQVEIPNASFSKIQFRLYDLLGKLVFEEHAAHGKDKWQIEVRGLAKGIHVLEITADDQVVHHKVVKK
jgi:uncharacterized protein YjdB